MEGGRWGLVIVASAFFIQVFAFGISASIGVYNIEFLDYFDGDTVGVSLISASNWALFLGSGPLASFLMTKFSYRTIALLGSVMVSVGVLLMPFLPYIPALCVCFGGLAGIGSCLVYIPSHVLCGLYYKRHQSLSTGIATSGSGLGGTIMPIVIGKLIQHYGWKGSLIIIAGLELHLIVFAALLRSPPLETDRKASDAILLAEQGDTGDVVDALAGNREIQSMNCRGNIVNGTIKTTEEISNSQTKVNGAARNVDSIYPSHNSSQSNPNKGLNQLKGTYNINHSQTTQKLDQSKTAQDLNLSKAAQDLNQSENAQDLILSETEELNRSETAENVEQSETAAFITKAPFDKTVQTCQSPNRCADEDAEGDGNEIKVLRHIYLFTDLGFDVYFFSSILWNTAAASVLAFGPELTAEAGISAINSAWLLTIFGLGDFIGGILGGVIGNIWVSHRLTQYVIANIVMGVSVAACPFGSTFGEFAAILLIGGLAFGVVLGLLVVVLIDLVGPNNLGDGLGYVMLANGIGAFCGPGLTGYLRKVTSDYNLAFYLAGTFGVLAGVSMWLIPLSKSFFPKSQTSKPVTDIEVRSS